MSAPANFVFLDDVEQADASDAAMVARIAAVRSKRELLSTLARQLEFPGYFGHNWDALFDCLCELPGPMMIIHQGLPLRTVDQRRTYLEVLRDASTVWAVFPSSCREQIISLLTSHR